MVEAEIPSDGAVHEYEFRGEPVEVRAAPMAGDDRVAIHFPERSQTAVREPEILDEKPFERVGVEEPEEVEEMPHEWIETPRCPLCSRFMQQGVDGEGFPSAQCPRTDCSGFLGAGKLEERGYLRILSED